MPEKSGPGSSATSIAESIVKPEGQGTKCIECDGFDCCCIPCTVM